MLVERVGAGRPVAHVAAEVGISRATAYKWPRRWSDGGRGRPARPFQPPRDDTAPHCADGARPWCVSSGRYASSDWPASARSWACPPRPPTGSWSVTA
ncbi:leucine zipper domain-containing protein [Streptomyces olivaceoviridis]